MGAYKHTLAYAQSRLQFGKPIASFQLVQDLLAKMIGNLTACQCMMVRLAQMDDEGKLQDQHASLAKAFCTARMREPPAETPWQRPHWLAGAGGFEPRHHWRCPHAHSDNNSRQPFVGRAGEQHWVPAMQLCNDNSGKADASAAGPSVVIGSRYQNLHISRVNVGPTSSPNVKKPARAKFPANSLLPQKNSLLGIQKFPAPLRREFGCKPMDSLAEWRRKLANEPKIFKNSLQIPC